MSDKDKQTIKDALDTLGLALTEYNHKWSDEERELYERAVALLT